MTDEVIIMLERNLPAEALFAVRQQLEKDFGFIETYTSANLTDIIVGKLRDGVTFSEVESTPGVLVCEPNSELTTLVKEKDSEAK